MTTPKQLLVICGLLIGITAIALAIPAINRYRTVTVHGAVIRQSADANKRSPIAGVKILASSDGEVLAGAATDSSGAFQITIRRALILRHDIVLSFRHNDYRPLDISDPTGGQLYVTAMTPLRDIEPPPITNRPDIVIAHISVRYTLKTPTEAEVGSGAKTFQVDSASNKPCDGKLPCSPDGKWKAQNGGASLDAGEGNYFRNGRVSCIAGPCPFTKIDRDHFSREARRIDVSVIGWSGTTTFLLQAEAVRHMLVDSIERAYPMIFDRTMNFSLPPAADGICIEADVDGAPVIFPINPNFALSWARCEIQTQPENNQLYRCELKPGFVFAGE